MKSQLETFLILFCLTATALAQTSKNATATEQFKNLAGEAEEIALMRLPAPQTLAISSKSALVPITIANADNIEIPIETTGNLKLMLIAPNSLDWKIKLALPDESFADLREESFSVNLTREETEYGFDGNQFPAQVFAFESVKAGTLRLKINLPNFSADSAQTLGYLVVASDSSYQLRSFINTLETVVGRELSFIAALTDKSETAQIGALREAQVRLQMPHGKTLEILLKDNNDGTFGGAFVPTLAGKYIAQIIVRGTTPTGEEFIRTSEHVFDVAHSRAVIGKNATTNFIDDLRLRISIPVAGVSLNQKLLAHAEVWARAADGRETPIGWIGGMTLIEKRTRGKFLSVILDSRWLARAGTDNKDNYELRNVRLQDENSFAVLGTAENVSLPLSTLPLSLQNYNGDVTDEMRFGKRPVLETPNAAGGKLMLVHGYCSGSNPWNPAQFADSVQFLDANQNRSHDQFAQLIRNFGAQYPSFGIVAHSQGGAAALHLYTYYWSGLDNATGSRLIQTVGTPYQGTALAGNLALIGSIFGAGCGSNTDLTYSGAAAWLANIPSWARSKVYYHTTSFTDLWWRYDYCNIASDLVLSDPDDGVTEKDKDQLSGANNMGHKTGWCHTSGMRDPAQTSDSSRNATMNAYAAR